MTEQMIDLTPTSILECRSEPLSAVVNDDLVMLDLRHDRYFGLDHIARRIWELLDGTRTITDVCDILVKEYDVDVDTCRTDVLHAAREFVDNDLVIVR